MKETTNHLFSLAPFRPLDKIMSTGMSTIMAIVFVMAIIFAMAWATLFFALPSPAFAQDASDKPTVQGYKDWAVQCPPTSETEKQICVLFYRITLENGYPLLVFQITKSPEVDDRFIAVFDVPLGVYLPTGITINVDEDDSVELMFERCDQNGCYAGMLLGEAFVEALKQGREAKVSFVDVANQKITATVSLSGFTAGLNAL